MKRDFGFAPNPFYGYCTLACCKPKIRSAATVGDWVVGTGSTRAGIENRLVYVMQVGEILAFDSYWKDPRFVPKRPDFNGPLKRAYGDNIYHHDPSNGEWLQENSHHSLKGGLTNHKNLEQDTEWTDRVLVATTFAYWGGTGPTIPADFDQGDHRRLRKIGPHHKSSFEPEFVREFLSWFHSLRMKGVYSTPKDWKL